jgi:putative ABC transport system permease protein
VLGTAHTGGIFVIFVEGILMVAGALLLYIFNATAVTAGLLSLAGGRNRPAPVARIALAYPSRRPGRTSVNLTIFALVIFTMVAIACFGATVQSNLNSTIQTQSGGYTFFGSSSLPIPDIDAQIANNTTLNRDFSVAVPIIAGAVRVAVPGSTPNPYTDTLLAAPGNQSPTSNFYTTNQFGFSATWDGLTTAEVWQQLADNGSVAVVDQSYAPATVSVTGGAANHPTLKAGTVIGLTAPGGNTTLSVRVIGIMSQSALSGVWINPGTAVGFGYSSEVGFLLTVRPGISADTASQDAKRAFFSEGLTLYDITAILQTSIASTEGFVNLLEIFVGLGLAVGIAAMGILALRAVVERRREIGMLRATGFTQGMVLRSFLLEYSYVTLVGVAIGASLALLVVYNSSISPVAGSAGITQFVPPWLTVIEIVIIAYGLVLVAIAGPSLRAARLPPAEAVRVTE